MDFTRAIERMGEALRNLGRELLQVARPVLVPLIVRMANAYFVTRQIGEHYPSTLPTDNTGASS